MGIFERKGRIHYIFLSVTVLLLFGVLVLERFRVQRPAQELEQQLLSPESQVLDERKKVVAFLGVLTAPSDHYSSRRKSLRKSWFPRSQAGLDRWEKEHSMVVRFVLGRGKDEQNEEELKAEEEEFGEFLRLDVEETYEIFVTKMLVYFKTIVKYYDADYVFKVDDDVFVQLERIPLVLPQWTAQKSDYIGCLLRGGPINDPDSQYHETQQQLIGSEYYAHARGPIYALSRRAAHLVSEMPYGSLRFFSNEDVTMGTWMAALNVTHFDDQRLCSSSCTETSVALYDGECNGLCGGDLRMVNLHEMSECRGPALPEGKDDLPMEEEKIKMSGEVSDKLLLPQ